MLYISPLSEYKFNLKAKKLEGLARLVKLKLPTVSNLFVVSPQAYQDFYLTGKLNSDIKYELGKIFDSITSQGETVTLRNAIFEKNNPAVAFSVANSPNIKTYHDLERKVIAGYKKAIKASFDPSRLEFSYLIQTFYSSEKCGTVLTSSSGHTILLQAILGQHTNLLFRGDIEPDTYIIEKRTYKLNSKHIAPKVYKFKKNISGLLKIRVPTKEKFLPVIEDIQALKIAKLTQKIEKLYGPQQTDWAILDDGKLIFQETHDISTPNKIEHTNQGEIIYPASIEGLVKVITNTNNIREVENKIAVIDNLDPIFINQLIFVGHPLAVILTKGSLTSHAATILREAKITTVLLRGPSPTSGDHISISKKGEIKKL